MSAPDTPELRPFQFSLATLFLALTLCCVLAGIWALYVPLGSWLTYTAILVAMLWAMAEDAPQFGFGLRAFLLGTSIGIAVCVAAPVSALPNWIESAMFGPVLLLGAILTAIHKGGSGSMLFALAAMGSTYGFYASLLRIVRRPVITVIVIVAVHVICVMLFQSGIFS